MKAVFNVAGDPSLAEWAAGVFRPSELQQKIGGLSFWQAERLREEGIDSVRNLAVKEIPDLIVKTRFETARLIDWVDQALLCAETGDLVTIESLRAVGVHSASDLLKIWTSGEPGQRQLVTTWLMAVQERMVHKKETLSAKSLALADDPRWQQAGICLLSNVVAAVQVGANIQYVLTYWNNSPRPEAPTTARPAQAETAPVASLNALPVGPAPGPAAAPMAGAAAPPSL